MTLRDLEKKLADAGVDSPRADVLALAGHVSGMGNASLLARYGYEVDSVGWCAELTVLVDRRAAREPLQYILGKWEFCGDEYEVSPDCLIPRPETEMLVEYALGHLPRGAHIADLCCGSGCIGIAICRRTNSFCDSNVICDSVDISEPALKIARKNAASLGVADRVTFTLGDVLNGSADVLPRRVYDMIISNPPYIKSADIASLSPEVKREPVLALDGGADGLTFYRAIMENYADKLKPTGEFVFEIGYDLEEAIVAEAKKRGLSAEVFHDLSSNPRTAVIRRAR